MGAGQLLQTKAERNTTSQYSLLLLLIFPQKLLPLQRLQVANTLAPLPLPLRLHVLRRL